MAISDSEPEVPTWAAAVVVVATVIAVFGYIFVYGGHLMAPLSALLVAGQVGLVLFVVYLLYRFVLAVERIADKL